MIIDITNPEHERALRSAVDHAIEPAFAAVSTYCADMAKAADPPVKWAFEALSDPAKAAELIRRLVERAGVQVLEARKAIPLRTMPDCDRVTLKINDIPGNPLMLVMPIQEARASIVRLLALAPRAGADAVLAALRGEP